MKLMQLLKYVNQTDHVEIWRKKCLQIYMYKSLQISMYKSLQISMYKSTNVQMLKVTQPGRNLDNKIRQRALARQG